MAHYIVTYDLSAPNRDYQKVADYLKKFPYAKPVESVWVIETSKSAVTVRDEIKAFVDSNDKVFVMKGSTADWGSYNVPKAVNDWLHTHQEAA